MPIATEFGGENLFLPASPDDKAEHCCGEEECRPSAIEEEASESGNHDSKVHGMSDVSVGARGH